MYPLVIFPDSALYLAQAKAFLHGEFAFRFMGNEPKALQPLFPLMSAILSFIFPSVEIAGTIVSVLSGSIIIFLVYYLSKKIFGPTTAVIASFIVTFDPILINFSIIPMSEALFTLLLIMTVLLSWHMTNIRNPLYFIIIGIVIGLSFLTRVIGVALLIPPILWLIINNYRKDIMRDVLLPVLFISSGFILTSTPYWTIVHQVQHKWMLTGFYGGVWEGMTQQHPLINIHGADNGLYGFLYRYIKSATLYITTFFSSISLLVTAFMILSLFMKRNRENLWKSCYLLLWIGSFFFVSVLFPPTTDDNFLRYLMPIIPLLFILSSQGIVLLEDILMRLIKTAKTNYNKAIRYAYLFTVLLLLLLSFISEYSKIQQFSWPFIWLREKQNVLTSQDVGDKIKNILRHSTGIIARKPYVPYYADAVWYPISKHTTYEDIKGLAKQGNEFLYLDSSAYDISKNLVFLLDPVNKPAELTPVIWIQDKDTLKYKVVLYHIRQVKTVP